MIGILCIGSSKNMNAYGLSEKRLHQTHMKEFLLRIPTCSLMGLNVESELRRALLDVLKGKLK
jgi:hypothetical protein